MANSIVCKKCAKYWELKRPKKNGSGYVRTRRGYCLAQSVFSSNKPGDHVYPPDAVISKTPNGQHQVKLVQEDSLILGCTHATPKED